MFHGYIDDVWIWDVARTETDLRNNMLAGSISGGESGLAAYWDFERGTDTSFLYDRTGNSNNGTIVVLS